MAERFQIQNCIDWNKTQLGWASSQIKGDSPASHEAERNARRYQSNIDQLQAQLAAAS